MCISFILFCIDGHHFFAHKSLCQSFCAVTDLHFDLSQLVAVVGRGSAWIGEMEQFCQEGVTLSWHTVQNEQGAWMEVRRRSSVPAISVTAARLLSVCVTSHHRCLNPVSAQTGPVMLTREVFCLISCRRDGLSSTDCQQTATVGSHRSLWIWMWLHCSRKKQTKNKCWSRAEKDAGRSGRVKALFLLAGAILKENEILLTLQLHLTDKVKGEKVSNSYLHLRAWGDPGWN